MLSRDLRIGANDCGGHRGASVYLLEKAPQDTRYSHACKGELKIVKTEEAKPAHYIYA